MTKRNNKNKKNLPTTPHQHDEQKKIVRDWNEYFGKNINVLSNWQKLCHDVGLGDNFTSKTQCRKVSHPASSISKHILFCFEIRSDHRTL